MRQLQEIDAQKMHYGALERGKMHIKNLCIKMHFLAMHACASCKQLAQHCAVCHNLLPYSQCAT